jgi:hypothetical protein
MVSLGGGGDGRPVEMVPVDHSLAGAKMIDGNDVSVFDDPRGIIFRVYTGTASVRAAPIPEDFFVETSGGRIEGKVGDYLVIEAGGDRWVVSREVFEATYTRQTYGP